MASYLQHIKKSKPDCVTRSIYLPRDYLERISKISSENDVSINQVIVSMIAACLEDDVDANKEP